MQTEQLKELGSNSLFLELSSKRRKARIAMVAIIMLVFMTTQVIWAFFPEIVGMRVPGTSSVSLGIWFTVFVVLSAIGLSGYYSLVLGKQLDELNEKLMREIGHE